MEINKEIGLRCLITPHSSVNALTLHCPVAWDPVHVSIRNSSLDLAPLEQQFASLFA